MKVLAFGEILWDIIEGNEHLGGAPFNFAAHVAQCGNNAFIASRVGSDALGRRAFNRSKEHGVDGSLIQWDERYPTGVVDVELKNGQPDYVIRANAAYDYISADTILTFLERNHFDVFYFGSLVQRNAVSMQSLYAVLSQSHFKHVFYDVNLRKAGYSEQIVKNSLAVCTILKLNNEEVGTISQILAGSHLPNEEFCKCVRALYPAIGLIIITAAENGCFIYESALQYIPGTPVDVCDAVGAGDAFSAAFMHIYAASGHAVRAAKIANQVGAFVATKAGAIPEYSPEIRNLLHINIGSLTDDVEYR
jgi:fructokinase